MRRKVWHSHLLRAKGITISRQRVEQRHKRFQKYSEQQLAKEILNLMTTKKATLKQIQIILDYYGVDLEKTMNCLSER